LRGLFFKEKGVSAHPISSSSPKTLAQSYTDFPIAIWDNKRYAKTEVKHNGNAPPEARLPPAMVGSVFLPLGLFWFAWTNYPSIHWSVSIIATAPFGFGMVLVFLSIM
jgi:hypothetical protein